MAELNNQNADSQGWYYIDTYTGEVCYYTLEQIWDQHRKRVWS